MAMKKVKTRIEEEGMGRRKEGNDDEWKKTTGEQNKNKRFREKRLSDENTKKIVDIGTDSENRRRRN